MSIYQNTKTHLHHIVPKRMGGTDDPSNLVELTIYDHAIAHRHLWKMYGDDGDRKAYYYLIGAADKGDELYEKISENTKIALSNPEVRKRISESAKRTKSTPEARKLQSEAFKRNWSNPEIRKRNSEAIKHAMLTPEIRQRNSEASKKRWADPEYRERMREATKRGIAAAKARRAAATTHKS